MLAYWLLYLIPAFPALLARGRHRATASLPVWFIVGLIFALAIGFRHRVGGDWNSYEFIFRHTLYEPMAEALTTSDPGYALLNWLMGEWGFDVYAVNLVAGAIFVIGLVVFCRRLSNPWLGFAIAVPYLLTVVAMGYTRQSVALGFFFLALAAIERGNFLRYLVWVVAGATFHKSAVLLVPLGIFLYGKGWLWRSVAVLAAAYGAWDALLAEHQEQLWQSYVEQQMFSQGAQIRVAMNLVPSLLFLYYRKEWRKLFPADSIWLWLALASLASFALVGVATTAVDRISLYFTPLQVAVFGRLPLLARKQFSPKLIRFGLLAGYALVLFVWLNYATHAIYWLPYRNILFE